MPSCGPETMFIPLDDDQMSIQVATIESTVRTELRTGFTEFKKSLSDLEIKMHEGFEMMDKRLMAM